MLSPPFTPTKVVILALIALIVWTAMLWQAWNRWRAWRRRRQLTPEQGLRPQGRRVTDRRKIIFTTALVALAMAMAGIHIYVDQSGTPSARERLAAIESHLNTGMRVMMCVLLGLLALLVLLWWISRDKSVVAAAKLASAGRRDEAEALIRSAIETKGPSERRLTVLGLLLLEMDRPDEALQQLEAAEQLAGNRPWTARNNRAAALWKLGRREEALPLLEEVCLHQPNDFTAVSNCCLLLAEMGRETEAYEYLERAERIYEKYDPKYTKHWLQQLERCREAVPTSRGFPVLPAARSGGAR